MPLSQVTCVVHNFQSRPPSGRRLSPWESLGQAPTMDSPLEKLSVAQVRGAGDCSRLERVVGGRGTNDAGSQATDRGGGVLRAMGMWGDDSSL